MMQAYAVPDVYARRSLAVENVPSFARSLICAGKGHNQIQLRAGIDHPSDASKNPIHFAKRSETIDVNGLQAGGLRQQFFVVHDGGSPHWWKHHSATTSVELQQFCDAHIQNVIGASA